MLNSGLVTYGLDQPTTGISRYTIELTRALAGLENGPTITLLTAGGLGLLSGLGLDHAVLPGCRRMPGMLTLGNGLISLLARRRGLELVHDPNGVSPFLFGAGGARTVVTVHDVFPWSYPETSTLLESLIYRHWLPRLLPRVDAVITDSQASKDDIARFLKIESAKIRVVHLGVDPSYKPTAPDRTAAVTSRYGLPDKYLLYLGSTRRHKNLTGLLTAYSDLERMGYTIPLVLVGVSAEACRTTLAQAPGSSDLKERIICHGHVSEADLPAIYSSATLFIRPVLYEGFGLPVLEAMACGTPVVCSNVASLPEVAGDAAITIEPTDVEALAVTMQRVLSDHDLLEELRGRGLERAANFTWERTARETVEVYEQVLRD